MSKRRKGRTYAMLSLFSFFVSETEPLETLRFLGEERKASEPVLEFARELIEGVTEHITTLDQLIQKHLKNWSLERAGNLEKTLLRIGAYELIYAKDTPASAVVHEALEIAKDYLSEDSIKFINGVLGSMEKEIRSGLGKQES